ncbi:MAG: type II 3-dehydroquinate dehydratase [Tissierellia bacterium]|nr:type II 3-dehydroquinate dehydratase [Tissierellia bacterium]
MKILIIHGPNMNLLGRRDKSIYGNYTLKDIDNLLNDKAKEYGMELYIFQSNLEGEIIDRLHKSIEEDIKGIVINPGAYTHYSIAIRDAIEILDIPIIEVHISNIYAREDFRKQSVIAPVCTGQITGLGIYSYVLALNAIYMMI